jgi:transcriptional regulator with XRE-family HTH domain
VNLKNVISKLEERRERLGLSCAVVAQRAGVGLRTVQRVLSGKDANPEMGTISRIAHALGASIQFKLQEIDIEQMKEAQAKLKAERLVALTQGSSGLEAQAVGRKTIKQMIKRTTRELLCGSPRKLWAA